jgi:hypothetical protein
MNPILPASDPSQSPYLTSLAYFYIHQREESNPKIQISFLMLGETLNQTEEETRQSYLIVLLDQADRVEHDEGMVGDLDGEVDVAKRSFVPLPSFRREVAGVAESLFGNESETNGPDTEEWTG